LEFGLVEAVYDSNGPNPSRDRYSKFRKYPRAIYRRWREQDKQLVACVKFFKDSSPEIIAVLNLSFVQETDGARLLNFRGDMADNESISTAVGYEHAVSNRYRSWHHRRHGRPPFAFISSVGLNRYFRLPPSCSERELRAEQILTWSSRHFGLFKRTAAK
jgi:hypothetical protein